MAERLGLVEVSIQSALKRIFAMNAVTFDAPSPTAGPNGLPLFEQGTLFVEVQSSKGKVKDRKYVARVTGTIKIFAQLHQLPIGFFDKMIARPEVAAYARDFFFYDLEESSQGLQNLVQRSASFVFFFNSQHDPDLGSINELELNEG